MFATSSTIEYSAMAAEQQCTSRAQYMPGHPSRMSTQAMCSMWAGSAANILLIQTGVIASVSLFVLLIILVSLLLVGLVSLPGLSSFVWLFSLSGLTWLVISPVGLVRGLSPGTKTGD